jgi:hypothetical protein
VTMVLMADSKSREVVLRRKAARRGYRLERCRRRDPLALGFGLYRLVDTKTGKMYGADAPGDYGLTLDLVQAIINAGRLA